MKPLSYVLALTAPGLLVGALAGCSSWSGNENQKANSKHRAVSQSPSGPMRGPGASAGYSGGAGSTGSGPGSEQLGAGMTADLAAMCELNRRIMRARTPEERQAMIDTYLPGMSADMRQRHLQMMQDRCQ